MCTSKIESERSLSTARCLGGRRKRGFYHPVRVIVAGGKNTVLKSWTAATGEAEKEDIKRHPLGRLHGHFPQRKKKTLSDCQKKTRKKRRENPGVWNLETEGRTRGKKKHGDVRCKWFTRCSCARRSQRFDEQGASHVEGSREVIPQPGSTKKTGRNPGEDARTKDEGGHDGLTKNKKPTTSHKQKSIAYQEKSEKKSCDRLKGGDQKPRAIQAANADREKRRG